jgi:hypothetical protein
VDKIDADFLQCARCNARDLHRVGLQCLIDNLPYEQGLLYRSLLRLS